MGGNFPPGRRDDGPPGRRLSDRISGFSAENSIIPAAAGLPPKPTPAALDTALVSGNSNMGRRNNRNTNNQSSGPPPPPPPDAKEDPRAAGGKRVSYHDMDLVAEVSVILRYFSDTELTVRFLVTGRCRIDVLTQGREIYLGMKMFCLRTKYYFLLGLLCIAEERGLLIMYIQIQIVCNINRHNM